MFISTKGPYIFPFDICYDYICLEMEVEKAECVMICVCYEAALAIIVGVAQMSELTMS